MANKYMNSADRAEENRSSAWTLLIVGGGGLLVILLGALGSSYIICTQLRNLLAFILYDYNLSTAILSSKRIKF